MTEKEVIDSLVKSSEDDVKTAKSMLRSKHYHWSLFIWHLAIEKVLKAKIVKLNKEIPHIHNLLQLAKKAEIDINESLKKQLKEIGLYNIEARYDDYKRSFYKKATKEYTERWVKISEKIYALVKKQI